jgi:hypothetical protein
LTERLDPKLAICGEDAGLLTAFRSRWDLPILRLKEKNASLVEPSGGYVIALMRSQRC